jgi:hypothetical protein
VQKGEQISSRKVTLGCETAAQRISDMTGCWIGSRSPSTLLPENQAPNPQKNIYITELPLSSDSVIIQFWTFEVITSIASLYNIGSNYQGQQWMSMRSWWLNLLAVGIT